MIKEREEFKERYKKYLTVEELIKLLQKCTKDKKVIIEGCDCYGVAENVTENEEEVCIERDDRNGI